MTKLEDCPNIGKQLADQLHEIGIDFYEDLAQIGSKEAWKMIYKIDQSACYNRLCALEGAIQNVRWFNLPKTMKSELKEFYILQKNKSI